MRACIGKSIPVNICFRLSSAHWRLYNAYHRPQRTPELPAYLRRSVSPTFPSHLAYTIFILFSEEMGCYWNMPANYDAGVFESCQGDDDLPMGVYSGSTW